eukprot:Tamp_25740.p2 GENE.Tamp_25740~~Tamp_25740.p2  ORF type:complete len:120 (+),score=9.77 Tamp_25740:379-738(+)
MPGHTSRDCYAHLARFDIDCCIRVSPPYLSRSVLSFSYFLCAPFGHPLQAYWNGPAQRTPELGVMSAVQSAVVHCVCPYCAGSGCVSGRASSGGARTLQRRMALAADKIGGGGGRFIQG